MANEEEVREALLDKIVEAIGKFNDPRQILKLAEAYAWTVDPRQPHGGVTTAEK